MKVTDELKPCPCCGSEVLTTYNTKFGFQVFCENDECPLNNLIMKGMETEEQSVEEWNKKVGK